MNAGKAGKPRGLWMILAILAFALAAVAAGCGGGSDSGTTTAAAETTAPADTSAPADTGGAATNEGTGEPIKIGMLSTCEGPFAGAYQATVAGALAIYIEHGATPMGPDPSDGVNWEIGGHPVQVIQGCSDASADKALSEARRLVEQEHVQSSTARFLARKASR